ncbi:MAG: HAD-superfamily subfamily hydrolase [Candidatus Saccharibacteria bacterium]|nr:HAD-superfamily subfamily hydrolase [Candidatus Saccharibacteria bacterium]
MKKFAVFDIDGTLIRWQFFHAIVNELGKSGHITPADYEEIKAARMRWKVREHTESFRAYESTLVHAYLNALTNISETDHDKAVETVYEEYREQMFTYPRNLFKQLKEEGYLLFIVSGSHEAILSKLAEELGFDDYVGAKFTFENGRYTGVVHTPVHDKGSAVKDLVKKHSLGFEGSMAIGDSESDIAMLELVENPIAFNPSRGLFEHAKEHGWRIVLERKNVVYELEPSDDSYRLK